MEAAGSPEMLVLIYKNTRCHEPQHFDHDTRYRNRVIPYYETVLSVKTCYTLCGHDRGPLVFITVRQQAAPVYGLLQHHDCYAGCLMLPGRYQFHSPPSRDVS
jgi:hypothetical protein